MKNAFAISITSKFASLVKQLSLCSLNLLWLGHQLSFNIAGSSKYSSSINGTLYSAEYNTRQLQTLSYNQQEIHCDNAGKCINKIISNIYKSCKALINEWYSYKIGNLITRLIYYFNDKRVLKAPEKIMQLDVKMSNKWSTGQLCVHW